ncbi:hypothetical protein [Wenyingzhuangia sp. IMCC45574]
MNSITVSILSSFNEEKQTIDFTEVDRYPLFKKCDPLQQPEDIRICFETELQHKINTRIQNLKLKTNRHFSDTLIVEFNINNKGFFEYKTLKIKDSTSISLPQLSSEIQKIILGLEPIQPATKRDIPVTTHYKLPILIKTK